MVEQPDSPAPSDTAQVPDIPVCIAAFEGWNDAGEATTGVVDHLVTLWAAQEVATIDPDEYVDFQVNRPLVKTDHGDRFIEWPAFTLYRAVVPGRTSPIFLFRGVEPNMRWRKFITVCLDQFIEHDCMLLISLGALLSDVPHTRPLPVQAISLNAQLRETLDLELSQYDGPTGIVGVLSEAAHRRGLDCFSLWASVPRYVGQAPSPKATLAVLSRLEDYLAVPIDAGELTDEAVAWERAVSQLAEEDNDIAEYIEMLEESTDTSELPEATGEAIARDFERYLKRRTDNQDGGE